MGVAGSGRGSGEQADVQAIDDTKAREKPKKLGRKRLGPLVHQMRDHLLTMATVTCHVDDLGSLPEQDRFLAVLHPTVGWGWLTYHYAIVPGGLEPICVMTWGTEDDEPERVVWGRPGQGLTSS